jgi:ABC-type branched-subunit amino acid transport system ATPase component
MTLMQHGIARPQLPADGAAMKLHAAGIVMTFGGVRALDGVDFWVPEGAAVGLLGQNGSGKTTLLNVVTGQLRPQQGAVSFNGQKMLGRPLNAFAAAGIARVFQSVQIFPRLTVLENVTVAQLATGESANSRPSAESVMERMRLSEFAGELARDISYGHQRLLEIAMAVGAGAELILLDEPTAGMAPAFVETVIECLRALNAAGTSLVLIEHETEVVFRVCQMVWVLNEGQVIACDTPADIRTNKQVLELYLGTATRC